MMRFLYSLLFLSTLIGQIGARSYTCEKTSLRSRVSIEKKSKIQPINNSNTIIKKNKKPYRKNFLVMRGRNTGMFHVFDCVCNLLKCYETHNCQGIEVDFDTNGVYYEPSLGKNWWSYYCEPIKFGKKINVKTVVGAGPYIAFKEEQAVRKEIFTLIKKYFHIKPHIQEKINTFEKENFKDHFVISVHYRGTDKIKEAPRVPYEKIPEEILKVMKRYGDKKFKIFIATDEQDFLDYIQTFFGDMICYNKDALRSTTGTPVHLDKNFNRYKSGEDALIDCILLSRGNFLIRSNSNLSRWSTYFNPKIPFIELNKRYNDRNTLEYRLLERFGIKFF